MTADLIGKIHCEPCLETLAKMEDESIDMVCCSPPYWQLRDYGYSGQWGLEPTYQQYLDNLISLMKEVKRVLKPSGTIWINLGDSYSGSNGNGYKQTVAGDNGAYASDENYSLRTASGRVDNTPTKSLILIPHRFAIRCMDELGLIVRNDIVWAKRNGMPESVTDRFSKKHEYFFFMVKQQKYYFDLDSIRSKNSISVKGATINASFSSTALIPETKNIVNIKGNMTDGGLTRTTAGLSLKTAEEKLNPKGKNPGSVSDFWDIPTKPSSEKHYASYNDNLLKKPVSAGCPEQGIIYDPFMGTGQTAIVALRANRRFIGSEMKQEYVDIANKRLKPYLMQGVLF